MGSWGDERRGLCVCVYASIFNSTHGGSARIGQMKDRLIKCIFICSYIGVRIFSSFECQQCRSLNIRAGDRQGHITSRMTCCDERFEVDRSTGLDDSVLNGLELKSLF